MPGIKIEKVIRTNRKTIALEITDQATLIVRAPFFVSPDTIHKVIERHLKTLLKRMEIVKTREKLSPKFFVSGESFLYLGRPYRLFIVKEQEEPLKFQNSFFLKEDFRSVAVQLFKSWYKKAAQKLISERVNYYSRLIGIKFCKVKITSAQKRWASCSGKGNLNFSYRLAMAPLSVIDYVVVHELCHIVEPNHSKAFWEKVKVVFPNYKDAQEWLKEKGHLANFLENSGRNQIK